jgi:hypothetical protein
VVGDAIGNRNDDVMDSCGDVDDDLGISKGDPTVRKQEGAGKHLPPSCLETRLRLFERMDSDFCFATIPTATDARDERALTPPLPLL